MDLQNWTLASNGRCRLTDVQLAMLWQAEFPNSRSRYTIKNVRGVRNLKAAGRLKPHVTLSDPRPLNRCQAADNVVPRAVRGLHTESPKRFRVEPC